MKRVLLFLCLLSGCFSPAFADHITGGEVSYTFVRLSGTQYTYAVTVKMFMRCDSDRELNNPAAISVFNLVTGVRVKDYSVPLTRTQRINLTDADPCITNPPQVCHIIGYYQFEITVPGSPEGYIITAQVVFRVDGMNNLITNYNQVGATYTAVIPSNAVLPDAPENNSAHFEGNDLAVVCAENAFSYNFAANDVDGDELRFSFCNAYQTSGLSPGDNMTPPPSPPYQSVPYGNGYSGSVPLGANVRIDAATGVINGIAPSEGIYVVTVCVEEIRRGVVIATQRKDLQINITPCGVAAAALPFEYILCENTTTLNAKNLSTSPLIDSYNWEFTDRNGNSLFTGSSEVATYTFADTGIYTIKLVINQDGPCSDSTTAQAKVYPGFIPDFGSIGSCISNPIRFIDGSGSVYGVVNSWQWNFGETTVLSDTTSEMDPFYTYPATGRKQVQLITADSKGCRDTVAKTITIFDKPPVGLLFRDTLICPPDDLPLQASGNGIFSWSPQVNMTGAATSSPVVSPVATTTYYVSLNDDGCINNDSVRVNVVTRVALQIMPDTLICQGDEAQLSIVTNGLKFLWTPAESLQDAMVKDPLARPVTTTTYRVAASISNCTASDQVVVTTVPYPYAYAGMDTLICFNTSAPLLAATDGNSYNWKPDPALLQTNILNPVARPASTSSFVFYAYDTRGCPKAGTDTVIVTVLEDMNASAGADTVIVTGQPLQLRATGGIDYTWSPSTALSATDIFNPIALFNILSPEKIYPFKVVVRNEAGCSDSAFIRVRVFASEPDIFVPSAFTPNGDGLNDFFQPVAAGIRQVDLFRVYNRWGQLVYSSTITGRGWDGNMGGQPLPSGTFVWMLKASDYTGRVVVKKGTVLLIR